MTITIRNMYTLIVILIFLFPSFSYCSNYNKIIYHIQIKLKELGYNPGKIDGIYGFKTRNALLNFKRDNGLKTNSDMDENTLSYLGIVKVSGEVEFAGVELNYVDKYKLSFENPIGVKLINDSSIYYIGKNDAISYGLIVCKPEKDFLFPCSLEHVVGWKVEMLVEKGGEYIIDFKRRS